VREGIVAIITTQNRVKHPSTCIWSKGGVVIVAVVVVSDVVIDHVVVVVINNII
jgi:hypothetical protein